MNKKVGLWLKLCLIVLYVGSVTIPQASAAPSTSVKAASGSRVYVYAFVATGSSTHPYPMIYVMDVTDPASVAKVGQYDFAAEDVGGYPELRVSGRYLYVSGNPDFVILDIGDPAHPTRAGYLPGLNLGDLEVVGNVAYGLYGSYGVPSGIKVIDFSNPAAPNIIKDYPSDQTVYNISISNQKAYIARIDSLWIVDLKTWASYVYAPVNVSIYHVSANGNYAFIDVNGVQVWELDVSNPASVKKLAVGLLNNPGSGYYWKVLAAPPLLFLTTNDGILQAFNISVPGVLAPAGNFNDGSGGYISNTGSNIYVSSFGNYFFIYDASNPASVRLARKYTDPESGVIYRTITSAEEYIAPPEVKIAHIEVFQGVQNQGASVPNLAGRPTLVRAYLDCGTGCSSAIINFAQLTISSPTGLKTYTLDQPIAVYHPLGGWASQQGDLKSTLNFMVDPKWVSGQAPFQVTFTVKVNNQQLSVTPTFERSRPIRLALVPVQATYKGKDVSNCRTNPANLLKTTGMVLRLFPTSQVTVTQILPTQRIEYPNGLCWPSDSAQWQGKVIKQLNTLYPNLASKPDFVFAWLPTGAAGLIPAFSGGRSDPSWANGANRVAFGFWNSLPWVGDNYNRATLAHELGHLLGMRHSNTVANLKDWNCAKSSSYSTPAENAFVDSASGWPNLTSLIPDYSMDLFKPLTSSSLKKPGTQYDYMSYCRNLLADDVWTAAWTYSQIHQGLLRATSQARPAAPSAFQYNISGEVFKDGTGQLDPAWMVLNGDDLILPPFGEETYCIEGDTLMGGMTVSSCFGVSFKDQATGEAVDSTNFNLTFSSPGLLGQLRLTKAGQVLASWQTSDQVPAVDFLEPVNGAQWPGKGSYTIRWQGTNPIAGSQVYYSVFFSPDGQTWMPLASDLTQTELTVNTEELPACTACQVLVQASNGLGIGIGLSGQFSVAKKGALISILSPLDNSIAPSGQPIWLEGAGFLVDEPSAEVTDLHWESDVDGNLGTGPLVQANLSYGQHHIRLWTTGPDGSVSQETISLFVGSKTYLPLTIKGSH